MPNPISAQPLQSFSIESLQVQVFKDRRLLGISSGTAVAEKMRELLHHQANVRMIFAAAPSQNEFLETLVMEQGLDWSRVTAFHMDEYIGLLPEAPQRFGRFLSERLFNIVKPGTVHLIDSHKPVESEREHYSQLLAEAPIDIVCMGIGENGHIAFNDPPVADFEDPLRIKAVELDAACRQQQVNDGCFATIDNVPTHALTLTIPMLMSGRHLFCMVPGPTKRQAILRTLHDPVSTECPASILRSHPDCKLYVDIDSYSGGEF
jgi:glucosamine-6-phosphate deaminase